MPLSTPSLREWNTIARNCHVAQAMLRALLSSRAPQELLAVPGGAGCYAPAAPILPPSLALLRLALAASRAAA
jgi:hypothetical protein